MNRKSENKVKETEEEKKARWEKNRKMAKSIAKMSGIDIRALAKERRGSKKGNSFDY